MTPKIAGEILLEAEDYIDNHETIEALQMGVEALKKQTPMKPIITSDDNGYSGEWCPSCMNKDPKLTRYTLVYHTNNYCGKCGQRLDWTDKEADDGNTD